MFLLPLYLPVYLTFYSGTLSTSSNNIYSNILTGMGTAGPQSASARSQWAVGTEMWRSQFRSGSARGDLALAVEDQEEKGRRGEEEAGSL